MPEQHFELLLNRVGEEANPNELANNLSMLLQVDVAHLEKQMVKVKLFHGQSHVLKTGLLKAKAERFQKVFSNLGLETEVREEWALEPIKETVLSEEFECPACGTLQEAQEDEIKICSECGIVKDKFEAIEKRKNEQEEQLNQLKALDQQSSIKKPRKSITDQNEEYFQKQLKKHQPKKETNVALLASVLVGVSVIGMGGYLFFNQMNSLDTENPGTQNEIVEKNKNSDTALVRNTTTNSPIRGVVSSTQQSNMHNGLGNPYAKFITNSSVPAISLAEAPEYVETILENPHQLKETDKAALEVISDIYTDAAANPQATPNYTEIRDVASSIGDESIKTEVARKIAWGEVKSGLKNFDDFGINTALRLGENGEGAALPGRLVDLYIKDNNFTTAAEAATHIDDPYLRAVAFNKILSLNHHTDLMAAQNLRVRIQIISGLQTLTNEQKPLVLGILSRADFTLRDFQSVKKNMKDIQSAVNKIRDRKKRIATLIQLAEDQREGLNLKYAHLFLNEASVQLENMPINTREKDKAYSIISEQYAKLFDFDRAKVEMGKISDPADKVILTKIVSYIEQQTFL